MALTRVALPFHGVALGGFALAPGLIPGVLLLTSADSANQLIVAAPMRGRVIGVRLVCFTAAMPLGSLAQGWEAVAAAGVVLAAAVWSSP